MAKSYLAAEELAQIFHTIPELEGLCEMCDPNGWGLLTRGRFESKFGIPGDGWELRIPLTQIWEELQQKLFPGAENADDIFFYYEVDVATNDLRYTFIRAAPQQPYQPGISLPPSASSRPPH